MTTTNEIRVYCAAPFFNRQQLDTLEAVEATLEGFSCINVFKPRNGTASALKLNKDIGAGKDPSEQTRHQVFRDNVDNIDTADLVVAIIDDRDIGTIFEIGYACKANVPIITFTNMNYGMNLMLAESTLAHCKGTDQLHDAIELFIAGGTYEQFDMKFKRANLSEGVDADKKLDLYKDAR